MAGEVGIGVEVMVGMGELTRVGLAAAGREMARAVFSWKVINRSKSPMAVAKPGRYGGQLRLTQPLRAFRYLTAAKVS